MSRLQSKSYPLFLSGRKVSFFIQSNNTLTLTAIDKDMGMDMDMDMDMDHRYPNMQKDPEEKNEHDLASNRTPKCITKIYLSPHLR